MVLPLRRRALLSLCAAPAISAAGVAPPPLGGVSDASEWEVFCRRFVRPEGRVVDSFNGGVSHTEGQGWGMLCAERCNDRAGFDRLWSWTRRTLWRPDDALFAWRFKPDGAGGGQVDDRNNAADGDLMIAWALLRGGERWGDPALIDAATAIARDILRLLVRQVADETVLLPGTHGFEQRDHVVVNPSYYAFPAIRALAQVVPDPIWLHLAGDGLSLIRRARYGRWGLPADWVALPRGGGRPVPAPGWPARFSYDAVRVPLYLAWAGMGREPAAASAARFWADPGHPRMPAWTDFGADSISPYVAPSGIRAIAQLTTAVQTERSHLQALPSVGDAKDYYSAMLTLLTRLALRDFLTSSI